MRIKNISIQKSFQSRYGIGCTQSGAICNFLGISPLLKTNQLTRYEKNKIWNFWKKRNKIIENPLSPKSSQYSQTRSNRLIWMKLPIEDNLKLIEKNDLLHLVNVNSYRGFRMKKGLPVRGQRTHSNAETCKKNKRKLGSLFQSKKKK